MWSSSDVVRYGWLTYLHLFFVLHQPLMPVPPWPLPRSLNGLLLLNSAGANSVPGCRPLVPSPLNMSLDHVSYSHSMQPSEQEREILVGSGGCERRHTTHFANKDGAARAGGGI
jgi:hypothetical protein